MIWNFLKSIFWCGLFHKPNVVMDPGDPEVPIADRDIGQFGVCTICGTTYEVSA